MSYPGWSKNRRSSGFTGLDVLALGWFSLFWREFRSQTLERIRRQAVSRPSNRDLNRPWQTRRHR